MALAIPARDNKKKYFSSENTLGKGVRKKDWNIKRQYLYTKGARTLAKNIAKKRLIGSFLVCTQLRLHRQNMS